MNKIIDKYYGPYKITDTIKSKEKTYLGKERIILICDNKQIIVPTDRLDDILSKDKKDLTELRELRVIPVIRQILTILVESELTKSEIDYAVGPKLVESLSQSFAQASSILWGNKEREDITLMDIQKVLMTQDDKNESRKSTSK